MWIHMYIFLYFYSNGIKQLYYDDYDNNKLVYEKQQFLNM